MDVTELRGTARELEERVRPQLEEAKQRLEDLTERAGNFVKERPVACLFGALAIGYLIARVARRA